MISTKKNEIDQLHMEIIGYDEQEEDTDTETHIEGLKDELEKSYTDIRENLTQLHEDLSSYKEIKEDEFKVFISQWDGKILSVSKKIKSLLPDALTAGLSEAYSTKKLSEEKEGESLYDTFKWAIFGLVIVSLIPFGVSINFLKNGDTVKSVLLDMPRLVFSILPIYIPILWVAYFANKKMNLSKRLVEEYTHKEVLSKTFEGLSTQINDIDDEEIAEELRGKLLFNILNVSSENPGKLISDYNKSDHPLMDALDKSVKLANSIETLSRIPGMSKMVNILEKKAQNIIDKEAEKADFALDSTLEENEEPTEKKNA